ncbi:MAG: beta-N-acetylglucosaminidase domain-containing protein, partial [Prevotella sp.]|nr:beta-N-acetylglucosaminidase domain-containing protein [Prevotella sp.]
ERSALTKKNKYDRHVLHLWKSGDFARLIVLGEHTDAVFFGLASLEQMLDQYATDAMPTVTISDYADLESRGLVEGYYGYPYSISVKKDLMRFMMRYKMNTYLYGAKSDPYHSQNWQDPYPTSITAEQEKNGWLTQKMLREITAQSAATKVNFIWAIHPGNNFIWSGTVVSDILSKFDKMYKLGVRQFAIFVDDVGLPGADKYQLNADRLTAVQRGLEKKYNKSGVAPADTVRPVHFVPQIYALGWVGADARAGFYKALATTPKNVTIYTTGWGVWSIPNSGDLEEVKKYLGRDVAWWWNYPCNDNSDGQIYTKDMYANFFEMPSVSSSGTVPSTLTGGIGIVSNPMQEGEMSKVALFSVADYSWNNAGFNNSTSYKAAVKAIVGNDDADDFSFLCDYLRWNDPTAFETLLNNVKTRITNPSNTYSKQLRERMERLKAVCAKFVAYKDSERECDRLLYADISPWLLKLQAMVGITLDMMDAAQSQAELEERWTGYVAALEEITDIDVNTIYTAYALEGMGGSVSWRQAQTSQKNFYPFVKWMRENILKDAFGAGEEKHKAIHNLPTAPGTTFRATYSSSTNVYYLGGTVDVPTGRFVGISLPQAIRVKQWNFDEGLLQNFTVRYSDDFRTWKTMENAEELPENLVKYVIFENIGSETQTATFSKAMFSVMHEVAPIISSVTVPEGDNAEDQPRSNLTDGDYSTWWAVKKNQSNGDTYVLNLAAETVIREVRICFGTKNDDYLNTGRVEVSADGSKWTALKVKGTSTTNFTLTASYAIQGGNDMKFIDFDGGEASAKYVRLRVVSAKTNKWLRLFEMEVNKQSLTAPQCYDANGNALNKAVDALPYTSVSSGTNCLIDRFVQPNPTLAVTVYSGTQMPEGVSVEVTNDGESWTQLGSLTQSAQRFDLSQYPEAHAVRLTWNGAAPTIYEIVEEFDASTILPTAIGIVYHDDFDRSRLPIYDLQGRRVVTPQKRGIYIQGGRKIIF